MEALLDPREEGAIELSYVLLLSDLNGITIVVNDSMQDCRRVSVLFVTQGQCRKQLLCLEDQLLRGLQPLFNLGVDTCRAILVVTLLLFLLNFDVGSQDSSNETWYCVEHLQETIKVACYNLVKIFSFSHF